MARRCAWVGAVVLVVGLARFGAAAVPLGGFIPYVGLGMTDEFDTFDSDPTGAFFIADRSLSWGGSPLGPGSSAYFDIALLDTGAATHILTQAAASGTGFSIQAEGLRGTNFQTVFGASGSIDLRINDPAGVYVTGLANRTAEGASLGLDTATLRGQTSVATLEAPAAWKLPNVIGLPMAAQHGLVIRNDQPQIFTLQGRTVRTPNVQLIDLGAGPQQGILRRTELVMRPSASFISGPFYLQSTEIGGGLDFDFHNNPLSPTVVDSGGLFVATNLTKGGRSVLDKEFLFDTGADLTVVSSSTAAKLGFDILLDEPDFELEVEGAGGVTAGVPGFYVDALEIPSVGGSFVLHNVPVAVVDLPNPSDPGNHVPGILGMHLFTGRNLVIDASPAATPGSPGSRLYIGDVVYQSHAWTASGTAAWASPASWAPNGAPTIMWDAQVINGSALPQTASVDADSTVYRMTVAGTPAGSMTVVVNNARTLTVFGETLIEAGGVVQVLPGGKLDAQFINMNGGRLTGSGQLFVGTGPVNGAVRNLAGTVAPDAQSSAIGQLQITGDLANLRNATLAFDIAGAVNTHDMINVTRSAYLGGTLQVSLLNYAPAVGSMFSLITAGDGVYGQFDQLVLPDGYQWQVQYNPGEVLLKVTGLAALPGDFDNSGAVNAADLVAWRAGYGTSRTGHDLLAWQRNLSAGGGGVAALPEPAGAVLAAVAMLALVGAPRRLGCT